MIYLANGEGAFPVPGVTNTSTQQTTYTSTEVEAILSDVFAATTKGFPASSDNSTDPEWPACLACAVVDRVRAASSTERSGVCASCFDRYCWVPSSGQSSGSGNGSGSSGSGSNSSGASSERLFSLGHQFRVIMSTVLLTSMAMLL